MFEGIELKPGDEIICPTYTFFATISPIVYTGAIPVFCDCDESGNISPEEIRKKISSRTKAVIVTHMWGLPCDMVQISRICQESGIRLLEDCSHAHGASVGSQKVGSFGDAAAWSLQGQKIVTGGEGGILLTNSDDIFYRGLLQGHYNKRCKQEIPKDHELHSYAQTGFGLKLRAHPIAIAMANEQFSHLDEWIEQKQLFVNKMIVAFKDLPFLKTPKFEGKQPSWYAFVMQYDSNCSNGVTINQFVDALHAEGLQEVDRPGSTSPVHSLPLFTNPRKALPRLYDEALLNHEEEYPNAEKFYENAIKLPVWSYSDEASWVDTYIEGILKVGYAVLNSPEIFK